MTLTPPADGATVSGLATLTADAADDSGVASVQFKVGGANVGRPTPPRPYTVRWDTRPLLNGPRTLTAVATDTAGLTTTSASVTVQVHNPATVRITAARARVRPSPAPVTVVSTPRRATGWPATASTSTCRSTAAPRRWTSTPTATSPTRSPGCRAARTRSTRSSPTAAMSSSRARGGSVTFSTLAPDTTPPTVVGHGPGGRGHRPEHDHRDRRRGRRRRRSSASSSSSTASPLGAEDTTAPYAVSWDTTTATNGSHTLTGPRPRQRQQHHLDPRSTVTVANTDPRAQVGEWGPVTHWPLVAVHATLMHTGEVLMWDAWELPTARAKLWNPTTNTFTDVPVGAGLFCAGQATDADGTADHGRRPRRRRERDQGRVLVRPGDPSLDPDAGHALRPVVPQPHPAAGRPDAHPQRAGHARAPSRTRRRSTPRPRTSHHAAVQHPGAAGGAVPADRRAAQRQAAGRSRPSRAAS